MGGLFTAQAVCNRAIGFCHVFHAFGAQNDKTLLTYPPNSAIIIVS
jgi:hypothetical protein